MTGINKINTDKQIRWYQRNQAETKTNNSNDEDQDDFIAELEKAKEKYK